MIFIYDNLIATVIAMTVVMILAAIQMDATGMRISDTSRNAAVTQAETFGVWVEEEMNKVGRNLDDDTEPIVTLSSTDEDQSPTGQNTTEFSFQYATFEEGTRNLNTVTYTLTDTEEDRDVHVGNETVTKDLYRLERNLGGTAGSEDVSPPALGYFHVQRLKENLEPASTPSEIQFLRVKYSVVAPYQNEDTVLQEVHRTVVVPYTLAENE